MNSNSDVPPIRPTSIEKFHHFDSDSEYPNFIFGRLLVRGKIDKERALQACRWAGRRMPLFCGRLESLNGRLRWGLDSATTQLAEGVVFEELTEPPESKSAGDSWRTLFQHRNFMVVRQWPARQSSVGSHDSAEELDWHSEIWFAGHHSICDGQGAIAYMGDWWQVYDNLTAGVDAFEGLSKLDSALFSQRNRLGLAGWKYLKWLPFQAIGIFGATKFLFRKTAEFSNTAEIGKTAELGEMQSEDFNSDSDAGCLPSVHADWISASGLTALSVQSLSDGVSLNAMLMGNFFRAIESWRREHDVAGSPGEWIRVILPMSIRDISHRRMPAANRTSLVQIDRRYTETISRPDLYRSIDYEIGVIRRWQLDRMFLIVIRGMSLFDVWLKTAANSRKSQGFAVFTNLGQPLKKKERGKRAKENGAADSVTQLKPIEVDFVGPVRAGTPFNLSVAKYGERLRVTLHFDAKVVTAAQAKSLLDGYLAELSQSVDEGSNERLA